MFAFLDNEPFSDASYEVNYMHMRDDRNNLVVQFRQNKKAGDGNAGTENKDVVHVVYTGLASVAISDPETCFSKILIAVKKDQGGTHDWTECVAGMKTIW